MPRISPIPFWSVAQFAPSLAAHRIRNDRREGWGEWSRSVCRLQPVRLTADSRRQLASVVRWFPSRSWWVSGIPDKRPRCLGGHRQSAAHRSTDGLMCHECRVATGCGSATRCHSSGRFGFGGGESACRSRFSQPIHNAAPVATISTATTHRNIVLPARSRIVASPGVSSRQCPARLIGGACVLLVALDKNRANGRLGDVNILE